jgi:hypothetical protein
METLQPWLYNPIFLLGRDLSQHCMEYESLFGVTPFLFTMPSSAESFTIRMPTLL